jgi:hypothetical protein
MRITKKIDFGKYAFYKNENLIALYEIDSDMFKKIAGEETFAEEGGIILAIQDGWYTATKEEINKFLISLL